MRLGGVENNEGLIQSEKWVNLGVDVGREGVLIWV